MSVVSGHSTEEGSNYHRGPYATSGKAQNPYESLGKYASLGAEMFKNVSLVGVAR